MTTALAPLNANSWVNQTGRLALEHHRPLHRGQVLKRRVLNNRVLNGLAGKNWVFNGLVVPPNLVRLADA